MKQYCDQNSQTVKIVTLLKKIAFVFLDAFACHGKFYFFCTMFCMLMVPFSF